MRASSDRLSAASSCVGRSRRLEICPSRASHLPRRISADWVAEAAAENTTRSYTSALRYWAGWHAARYGIELALPVPEFVVDHVRRRSAEGELAWELPPAVDQALVTAGLKAKLGPWTLATVRHRVAVLSTAHRLKQVANPCEQPAIRAVLSRAARAAVKRGERPRKKTAITLPELEALLATCDDSLEGIRDRALLCFGFASGGRRRSEIATADLRDLRRIGEAGYIYRVEHSKTQQAGVTATSTPDKPVLDRAALALQDWLEAAGITEGAIFRRLWKQRVGPALSPAAVGEIVQRRASLAGLEGGFWRAQPAVGVRDRSQPSRCGAAGNYAAHRAPLGVQCCGVFSVRMRVSQSSSPPT